MSPAQVRGAKGAPASSRRLTNLDGSFEVWVYPDATLRFKGERLIEIRRGA